MDKSTVGGLVVAFVLILIAILMGSPLTTFWDSPSVVIVFGGTAATLYIGYPAAVVMTGAKAGRAAFFNEPIDSTATVKLLADLSNRARREGLLSLEAAANETKDEFLKRGLQMMADGQDPATIEAVLFEEIGKIDERHRSSIGVFEAMGAYAPAMGMIGTLVGLVQMLQNLEDPTAVGPAMAVALLTTFYGSVLANLVGLPIANKLKTRSAEEIAHKELITQGLLSILAGENPRFMVERLNATLPAAQRVREAA